MLNLFFALCGRFIVLGMVVFVILPLVFAAKVAGLVAGAVS